MRHTLSTRLYYIAGLFTARANRRKHSSQHHSGTVGNGLAGGGRVRNNVLLQTAGSLSVLPPSPFCFPSFRLFCGDVVFLFFPHLFFLWIVASLSVGLAHVIPAVLRVADPFTSVLTPGVRWPLYLPRFEVGFASNCKLQVGYGNPSLVFLLNCGLAVSAFMLTTTITTVRGAPAMLVAHRMPCFRVIRC